MTSINRKFFENGLNTLLCFRILFLIMLRSQVAAFHSRFCHSLGNFVPAPCPTQPGPLSHSFPWCCCSSFCVAAAGCQSPTFLPTINLTEEQLQKKCCPAHNKLLPLFWMEQPCPEVLLWMKMTIGPPLRMV